MLSRNTCLHDFSNENWKGNLSFIVILLVGCIEDNYAMVDFSIYVIQAALSDAVFKNRRVFYTQRCFIFFFLLT